MISLFLPSRSAAGRRVPRVPHWARWALLLAFAAALAGPLAGCRTDAEDQNFNFNNPLDPNPDSGNSTNGDNTGQVVIAQVNSDPDVVTIVNTGSADTDLTGWTLNNEDASSTYSFSGVTLRRDAYVNVHSATGTDTDTELYTNASTPNWLSTFPNSQAILRNAAGDAIDTCATGDACWQ